MCSFFPLQTITVNIVLQMRLTINSCYLLMSRIYKRCLSLVKKCYNPVWFIHLCTFKILVVVYVTSYFCYVWFKWILFHCSFRPPILWRRRYKYMIVMQIKLINSHSFVFCFFVITHHINDHVIIWLPRGTTDVFFLTYWGQNKMAAILKTTFSNALPWNKILIFWFEVHVICIFGFN